MRRLRKAAAMICLAVSWLLCARPAQADCAEQENTYRTALARFDRSCEVDADCVESGLAFNPVFGFFPVNRKAMADEALVRKARELREKLWKECGWVYPPGVHVEPRPGCRDGGCANLSTAPVNEFPDGTDAPELRENRVEPGK